MQASVPFTRSPAVRQRELWALAAVTLLGLVLRIVRAEAEPLWADEALTLAIVHWPAADLLVRPVDPTGGLYYVLHKLVVPDDARLAVVRAISIAAGTLSIPAMFAVARLATRSRVGSVLSAALLSIAPVLVDYSQEARAYALVVLLVLLSAVGLLAWGRRLGGNGGIGALVLFAVTTVLAYSAHLSAIFWVLPAVPVAVWLTLKRGTQRQRRAFILALAAMALGALPETIRLVWRASLGGGFVWLSQASASDALRTWSEVILPTRGSVAPLPLIAAGVLIGWRLVARRGDLRRWASESPAAAATIAILVAAPIGVWLFGLLLVPIFMPRTILLAIPGFILLVALVATLDREPWIGALALAAFGLSLTASGTVREKEDWHGTTAALARHLRPGDVILLCSGWKYPAFRHASTVPARVPLVALSNGRMVLMAPPAGTREPWARTYFRTAIEPPMRHRMNQKARLPLRDGALAPFRRAWVVGSECGKQDGAATAAWLGQGRTRLVWTSAPAAQHAPIQLWLFEAERRETRPLSVVTR